MKDKKKITKTTLFLTGSCVFILYLVCVLYLVLSSIHIYRAWNDYAPGQDADGYYLLRTKEDFTWLISTVQEGNTQTNVRLKNDIILNDTSDWENWANTPPEHKFSPMINYDGHFDGGGFALEGYYSNCAEEWQASIFTVLDDNARITDLHIRNSFFRTTYDDSSYDNDDGETNVVTASALCFSNYGIIEGCDVHAKVMGAWSAGGIVGVNYSQITDCHFTGSVEAGLAQNTEKPENRLGSDTLYAGGICRTNQGTIYHCLNEGSITLHMLPEPYHMHDYAAGGIVGRLSSEGIIENSENTGDVECVQLAGGIAGASWGSITHCINSGNIHVAPPDQEWVSDSQISAGICASNGGIIDTCLHRGSATVTQSSVSFYAPIYGISCNIVNPSKGTCTNCYYLPENTMQEYRQSGVYKLPADDMTDLSAYLTGDKQMKDTHTWELLNSLPNYPGTDENDYIRLGFGPAEDIHYEVKPGDSLWDIAETYYGNGSCYELLERNSFAGADTPLLPGEQITVPHKDYFLLRDNDEKGAGWCYCVLPSGESCPTHFIAARPIDWYYGYMYFDAGAGFDVMWPKDKEKGHDTPAGDIRILYRFDGNPDGDFFADWENVQQNIRESAKDYCGDSVGCLRFYCYTLDNGENLYGYSFLLYRETDTLKCAAFYRIRDGFLAEFIGIEPVQEDWNVLERVRYLAAGIDNVLTNYEIQSDCGKFYGKENWNFPLLHNPFATALAYSKDADCSSYMLLTGAQ